MYNIVVLNLLIKHHFFFRIIYSPYQKSVLKKYLKLQDSEAVTEYFNNFTKYFTILKHKEHTFE